MSSKYVALLLLVGCGEPLVGPEYLGPTLFEVGGSVVQMGGRIPMMHGAVTLSLFWLGADRGPARVEQSAELTSGLASFAIELFDAPPAEASTFDDLRGDQGRLALAMLALYADRDDNGRLDPDTDLVLGASAQHLIGWSDAPVAAGSAAAKLVGAVGEGYQLFEYDQASACPLVSATSCAGQGRLQAVTSTSVVVLTLWDDPNNVRVPSPALDMGTSIWAVRD